MLQVDMSATKRDNFGKCAMRRLRVSGNTPAVLYGNDKDVVALQLETTPFLKNLYKISRKNAVVNLSINGDDTRYVMMKEIQTDPVTDSLIHADFFEINLDKPKCFTVAIELTGTAKGLDLGGQLNVPNASVQIEGLPLDIPDSVILDIAALDIGDSIKVSDIELSENLKMVTAGSELCVKIVTKSTVEYDSESESATDSASTSDSE